MEEKLNPAQPYYDHKTEPSREKVVNYERAYEDLEIVNRGVNLIVDDASEIPIAVGGQVQGMSSVIKCIAATRLKTVDVAAVVVIIVVFVVVIVHLLVTFDRN